MTGVISRKHPRKFKIGTKGQFAQTFRMLWRIDWGFKVGGSHKNTWLGDKGTLEVSRRQKRQSDVLHHRHIPSKRTGQNNPSDGAHRNLLTSSPALALFRLMTGPPPPVLQPSLADVISPPPTLEHGRKRLTTPSKVSILGLITGHWQKLANVSLSSSDGGDLQEWKTGNRLIGISCGRCLLEWNTEMKTL